MPWLFLAIHDAVGMAAAVYLIISGYPWWAVLFILLVATATLSEKSK